LFETRIFADVLSSLGAEGGWFAACCGFSMIASSMVSQAGQKFRSLLYLDEQFGHIRMVHLIENISSCALPAN